jgi:hypothetical protein
MAADWLRMQFMNAPKTLYVLSPEDPEAVTHRKEVRCAVRFPIALPVVLSVGNEEITALTRDVSASVGIFIRFSLRMPGAVLGTPRDVLVHCYGRVVRCSLSNIGYRGAATIDEYQFAEQ